MGLIERSGSSGSCSSGSGSAALGGTIKGIFFSLPDLDLDLKIRASHKFH